MRLLIILLVAALVAISGCSSTKTFSSAVRAGETVTHAVGMQNGLSRDNVSITFTPVVGGASTLYAPGDQAIRAVVNLYPDPVSKIIVGGETGQELGTFANSYNAAVENTLANQYKDWWTTFVVFDVPSTLPSGAYDVEVASGGTVFNAAVVEVIGSGGTPNDFDTHEGGPLLPEMLQAMERAQNYSVEFSGSSVPHALQVEFMHDPDATGGGTGKPYVINPRGDILSITWHDDGSTLRVIVLPAEKAPNKLEHFKFYVAGGITGLAAQSVQAYDVNGWPVAGVTASVSASN